MKRGNKLKTIKKKIRDLKHGDTVLINDQKYDVFDAPVYNALYNKYIFGIVSHGTVSTVRNIMGGYLFTPTIRYEQSSNYENEEINVVKKHQETMLNQFINQI